MEALLAAGARVTVKGERGWDALMHAASCGDPAIVKALLAHGANPNTREVKAGSREDRADFRSQPPPLKLEPGTPVRMLVTARTALLKAAVRGNMDMVRELLAAGADPGLHDVSGKMALDFAASANKPDVVSLLQRAQAGKWRLDAARGSPF